MLVDFHMHTRHSDGALTVAHLLERLAEAEVALFAVTDHDTIEGVLEARRVMCGHQSKSPAMVNGVELSCVWSGVTIHVVGLGFDCDSPSLRTYLASIDQAREARALKIADRLAKVGFPGGYEGAVALAEGAVVGRPHFARWMVEAGYCDSADQAFKKWLGRGKIGDVKLFWPELETAVNVIKDSGGKAVLAHPHHYGLTRAKLKRLVGAFVQAGGVALERPLGKDHMDLSGYVTRLVKEYGLEVSLGSDFHADTQWGPRLGVDVGYLDGCEPVWSGWADTRS